MLKAQAKSELDRALALDIVRVTEATAVATLLAGVHIELTMSPRG